MNGYGILVTIEYKERDDGPLHQTHHWEVNVIFDGEPIRRAWYYTKSQALEAAMIKVDYTVINEPL